MKTNPSDQAFPSIEVKSDTNGDYALNKVWSDQSANGLTKREWFAGMAFQGAIASSDRCFNGDAQVVARTALQWADALIAELSKESEKV